MSSFRLALMFIILELLLIVLTGCSTIPKEVIPIPTPCKLPIPEKPVLRFQPPYDKLFDAVRDLLGDREIQAAYATELESTLEECKK